MTMIYMQIIFIQSKIHNQINTYPYKMKQLELCKVEKKYLFSDMWMDLKK